MASQITSLTIVYHYTDVIMTTVASQITSLTVVYSIGYSGADQRKHQNSASLAFVRGPGPVNSPHKMPVMWKMVPFDDVIMSTVYSGADQRKHQRSASLAIVRGIHRSPVNSPHKGPVTRKCSHLMTSSCYFGFKSL